MLNTRLCRYGMLSSYSTNTYRTRSLPIQPHTAPLAKHSKKSGQNKTELTAKSLIYCLKRYETSFIQHQDKEGLSFAQKRIFKNSRNFTTMTVFLCIPRSHGEFPQNLSHMII